MPRATKTRARRIFPVSAADQTEVEKAFRAADRALKDTNLDLDVAFDDLEANEAESYSFSWMGF